MQKKETPVESRNGLGITEKEADIVFHRRKKHTILYAVITCFFILGVGLVKIYF